MFRVHAIKSTSRLIGEEGLADLAEALKDAGNHGDLAYIRELAAAYDDESIRIIFAILAERTLPEECHDTYVKLKAAFEKLDWGSLMR